MADRRAFLAGMLATGLAPRGSWASLGEPIYLSAAKTSEGTYVICGLTQAGEISFQQPLPARGHAAAAHPHRAEAVTFARRPGTYGIVMDCITGHEIARLQAPASRHFYGHGAFSADGALLFTTENDFDAGRGVIGIWDVQRGYERVGDVSSGGVGPHDIKLMPNEATLVVANGGIETHPDTGRAKLNIPTMRANLSYLNFDGRLLDQMELEPAHQKNSIRHLAVDAKGRVAFAMQWQGDLGDDLPLLGVHDRQLGQTHLFDAASTRKMNGYLGSVTMTADGSRIAVTSPRSGLLQLFQDMQLTQEVSLADVCGVAPSPEGFMITTGDGVTATLGGHSTKHSLAWDNHLVVIR